MTAEASQRRSALLGVETNEIRPQKCSALLTGLAIWVMKEVHKDDILLHLWALIEVTASFEALVIYGLMVFS